LKDLEGNNLPRSPTYSFFFAVPVQSLIQAVRCGTLRVAKEEGRAFAMKEVLPTLANKLASDEIGFVLWHSHSLLD
jgi:hypothetical protein